MARSTAVLFDHACKILGVSADATLEDVTRAHRRLALEFHPDRAGSSEAALHRFREVQAAYETLRRSAAPAAQKQQDAVSPAARLPRTVPDRGPDAHGELSLTLADMFTGVRTDVTFTDQQGCERCGASGGEPGTTLTACFACHDGQAGCSWCAGSGELPDEPCVSCHGAGVVTTQRTVRVAIPRSVHDGEERLVPGKAKWGAQQRGDLRLRIVQQPQPGVRRIGDDVEVDVVVGVLEAVLGGQAQVRGPDKSETIIQIDPGVVSGQKLRIPGGGMYRSEKGDERGDLYAVVQIQPPRQLTERQRHLYQLLLAEERDLDS